MGEVLDTVTKVASLGTITTDFSGKRAREAAGRAQSEAMEQADIEMAEGLRQQKELFNPYMLAGQEALKSLQGAKFDFQADPSYNFRLQEGMKAINNAAAARGLSRSGATLKALAGYGQNLASQEYQNAYNRFNQDQARAMDLAGMGFNSASALAGNTGNIYSNRASNRLGIGNARAASEIAASNQQNALLQQGIGLGAAYLTGGASLPFTGGVGG